MSRLKTDRLDVVLIHSNGRDMDIMQQTDVVPTLQQLRDAGKIKQIGLSGKTVDGAAHAMPWADVFASSVAIIRATASLAGAPRVGA